MLPPPRSEARPAGLGLTAASYTMKSAVLLAAAALLFDACLASPAPEIVARQRVSSLLLIQSATEPF